MFKEISKIRKTILLALVITIVVLNFPNFKFLLQIGVAIAETMSSQNFKIQSDSINVGGIRSSSDSYVIEDTAGEIATGQSSSDSFILKAGYQQVHDVFLSVTPANDVVMSPNIGGITGGTANGSTSFTVTTDSQAGYTVTITASGSPALVSPEGDSFADYVPASSDPDFSFTNAANASSFAFTPEGDDIDDQYRDDGANCGTGSGDTASACWDGLSTSPKTIVTRVSSNQPTGTETTIAFRAESSPGGIQPSGGASFSDDFDRTDNASLGANWTEVVGDQSIVSNQLSLNSNDYAKDLAIYSGTPTDTVGQYVKAEVVINAGGNHYPEIVFRYSDSSSPYYGIQLGVNEDVVWWQSYDNVAGSGTTISNPVGVAMTVESGDSFGITVDGTGNNTVVRVWRNPTGDAPDSATSWGGDSTPDITFTDDPSTSSDTGAFVGLQGFSGNGVSDGTITFDNFFAGDHTAGESGSTHIQTSGVYTATTTLTIIAL